jgi:hypothetical protein
MFAVFAAGTLLTACQSQSTPPPAAASAAPPADPVEARMLGTASLRQLNCREAIENKEMFDAIMIWSDGYIHGIRRTAATSQRELTSHKNDFIRECERTPNASVHTIVLRIAPRVTTAASPAQPAAAPAAPAQPAGQRPAASTPAR